MDNTLIRKKYCSKLMKLSDSEDYMDIDNTFNGISLTNDKEIKDTDKMDIDNNNIDNNTDSNDKFEWIKEINSEIRTLKTSTLLVPIREIVLLGDPSISQKVVIYNLYLDVD